MRVLILSQWYLPEPAYLMQELAQTLQSMGHSVTVLTGFPNYPSGQVYPGYRIKLYQREELAGVPIIRVPLYPEHSHSGIKRALNYISFALSSSLMGACLARRPDVIFVYHPPLTVGIPAWVLSRVWRVPFVYQVQDMWPETLDATGMLKGKRMLAWIGSFAKWVYRRSNAICVISPGFRENLISKGVSPEKIHTISNWVDTESYHPVVPDDAFARELGLAGKFNVIYAGNIGEAQGLETVLDAAERLRDVDNIQFVLVGDGVALARLIQSAKERHLTNVVFPGRFKAGVMPSLYAIADVLLLHLKDDPLFRITIPHKLFTYMACGRPVLAAILGDAADIVRHAAAGICCIPGNAQALADAVRQFYGMTDDERATMGKRGLAVVRNEYSRKRLVGEIESLLRAVVSRRTTDAVAAS